MLKPSTIGLGYKMNVVDVNMGKNCSIWFNSLIRGDVNTIIMGNNVNIQDSAVIHCSYEKTKTTFGNNVSIGHNALVHGGTVEDNVLIGMGSIIMDNCHIESGSIIAAGAVSPELFESEVMRIAKNYRMYASWFEETSE